MKNICQGLNKYSKRFEQLRTRTKASVPEISSYYTLREKLQMPENKKYREGIKSVFGCSLVEKK